MVPEIISYNLGYNSIKDKSTIVAYFFTSFYYGIIVGSLTWPTLVRYISKRNCILIALAVQGLFNGFQIYFNSVWWLCFCRFICGFFQIFSTVGKDFIFEFALPEFRQYAFNFRSCFSILASFIGPFIGFHIYQAMGKSFFKSCLIISLFYALGIILFLLFFYIDYHPEELKRKKLLQKTKKKEKKDDEERELVANHEED